MTKYIINGGKPLHGTVTISGAKNAAVAILPATLLVKGVCKIENVPNISDVRLLLEILTTMGALVRRLSPNTLEIDCTHVTDSVAPIDLVRRIRASYYLIGAQLGRFGHACVALPGGCNFGVRPIDQHIKGIEAMQADVRLVGGCVCADSAVRRSGRRQNQPGRCLRRRDDEYYDCRCPGQWDDGHRKCRKGAAYCGPGQLPQRHGREGHRRGDGCHQDPRRAPAGRWLVLHHPRPDRSWDIYGRRGCGWGDVLVQNVIPKHMDCISAKLREMGVQVTEYDDAIRVTHMGRLRRANVKTMPYPGFPTDMQPQIAVCMALAKGTSIITEGIYDTRFRYCAELNRMGASIQVDTKVAVIDGVEALHGCPVRACDLRAGAAMVIAGLAADQVTTVEDAHYIERGYENIIEKLRGIGAEIRRVETPREAASSQSAG